MTSQTPLIVDSSSEPSGGGAGIRSNRISTDENSVSNSTTVTELTISPSVDAPENVTLTQNGGPVVAVNNKSNINLNYARNNKVLQPHQGQNPTVERNTHKRSDEELAILGNSLVDKSIAKAHQGVPPDTHNPNMHHDLFDTLADNLESSLVQNDSLYQNRASQGLPPPRASQGLPPPSTTNVNINQSVNPPPSNIPYLQNEVNLSEPLIVRPKMPNVPGNGASAPSARAANSEHKHKSKFRFPKRSKGEKGKGLSLPFFGKKSHHERTASDGLDYYPTENLVHNPLPLQQSSLLAKPGPSGQGLDLLGGATGGSRRSQYGDSSAMDIEGKSNLDPRPVSTEVRLLNGTPTVRPTSLPVVPRNAGLGPTGPRPGFNLGSGNGNLNMAGMVGPALQPAVASSGVPGYGIDQSTGSLPLPLQSQELQALDPTSHRRAGSEEQSLNPNINRDPNSETRAQSTDGCLGFAEVGVAKLQPAVPLTNGQAALVKVKGKSYSSGELSPAHSALSSQSDSSSLFPSGGDAAQQASPPRPKSLLVNGHSYKKPALSGSGPQLNNGRSSLENTKNLMNNSLDYIHATQSIDRNHKKRQKTPISAIKNGRISVSDEQVMSQSAGNVNNVSPWQPAHPEKPPNKSTISLQQFGSLDVNLQQVQDYEC